MTKTSKFYISFILVLLLGFSFLYFQIKSRHEEEIQILKIQMQTSANEVVLDVHKDYMRSVLRQKKEDLQHYFKSLNHQIKIYSASPYMLDALENFKRGWNAIEGDKTKALQQLYIFKNPMELGKKQDLNRAKENLPYNDIHARFHPQLRSIVTGHEYYDLLLIDLEGNVIYSVYKELDYATNLNHGKWKGTSLANAYRSVKAAQTPQFFDLRPYAPSAGMPVGFISAPIFNEDGNLSGILTIQLNLSQIDRLSDISSMDSALQMYIIGSGFLLMNNFKLSQEHSALRLKYENEATKNALNGKRGIVETLDYKGYPAFLAYDNLQLNHIGWNWAIVIDAEKAYLDKVTKKSFEKKYKKLGLSYLEQ